MTEVAEKIGMFLQKSFDEEKKRINTMQAMKELNGKYHVVFVNSYHSGFKAMVRKGNTYKVFIMKHNGDLLEVGKNRIEKVAKEIYNSLS